MAVRWASRLLPGLCALLALTPAAAFDHVFAVVKYDRDTWMESASLEAWSEYSRRIVVAAKQHGFTGLVLPATAPVADLEDSERHAWIRDKQLIFLDHIQDAGLRAIITVGNPGSRRWDKAGDGWPYDAVYRHPAVTALKFGDEPKTEDWERLENGYALLRAAYPELPIITIFVGETLGGPTDSGPDRLPDYIDGWRRLGTGTCVVRSYPFRSRLRPRLGIRGDFDLDNLYSPAKLAVHPKRMAELVSEHCPGDAWALVAQGFGRCRETGRECYWRLPTRTELVELARIAFEQDARWLIVWSMMPHRDDAFALLDAELEPVQAHDGSYPIDAIAVVSTLADDD